MQLLLYLTRLKCKSCARVNSSEKRLNNKKRSDVQKKSKKSKLEKNFKIWVRNYIKLIKRLAKTFEIGKCDMINQISHPKMKNHENRQILGRGDMIIKVKMKK